MNETIKALIEALLKEGVLPVGLIALLFGALALAIPDGWLLVNHRAAASVALLGVCAVLVSAMTHKKLWTAFEDARRKCKLRHAFLKLSNKARLMLQLQAKDSSEQVNVIPDDVTVQELITNQFWRLEPGHIGRKTSRATIYSDKYRWLMSDLHFVKQNVSEDAKEMNDLKAMMERAEPGPNSWPGY